MAGSFQTLIFFELSVDFCLTAIRREFAIIPVVILIQY